MSTSKTSTLTFSPSEVHEVLGRHILADGYGIVLDLDKSQGALLYDSLGNREILDFFTCFSTVPLGYNPPGLTDPDVKAKLVRAAVNKPSNSDLYTPEMAEFVATFARTLPESLSHHIFFISGGALAVENAMKAAFDWKHRKNEAAGRGNLGDQIIHFREAFHGRSGYTLSVTNTDPAKTQFFPKFDWPRITNPKLSFPLTEEGLEHTLRAEDQAVEEIKQALVDNRHDVAAILIEPIQGEGGDNHFRPEFLQTLRTIADENEILLIFDEVQTGFGATGKWWCFEHMGMEPDLVAFGKKTQVCGIAASSRLDEVESVFSVSSRINSTWGGNLVDMMRSRYIVEIIEREGLLEQARVTGERLLDGLRTLEQRFEGKVTNSRGLGLFLAVDLPDNEVRGRALDKMLDNGLLGLASGTRSIRFRPPLVVDEKLADIGLERLESALNDVL